MINIERRGFLRGMRNAGLLFVFPALAIAKPPEEKGNKNSNKKAKKNPHYSKSNKNSELVLSGISAARARDIFRDAGGKFGTYKPLPPGIRKNLARGKSIPPGIAKTRLSNSYLSRLPHYSGYEWIGAGSDLILVQANSGVIADVLLDVFR